jgi:hypothetical protein
MPTTPVADRPAKTWQVVANYDRARTRSFINLILGQRPTQVIFNDPQITGVDRVFGHHNHIHASFPYDRQNILDPGTGGAPAFAGGP